MRLQLGERDDDVGVEGGLGNGNRPHGFERGVLHLAIAMSFEVQQLDTQVPADLEDAARAEVLNAGPLEAVRHDDVAGDLLDQLDDRADEFGPGLDGRLGHMAAEVVDFQQHPLRGLHYVGQRADKR